MLRVVSVVDKTGTALDRLAKGVAKYHNNLSYSVLDVHPKRPSQEQLLAFEQDARNADVFDFQYYRTAEMLVEMYPWLAERKLILTHNNPYSIYESDWKRYDAVVANNSVMQKALEKHTERAIEYIPLAADTDFWLYNQNWKLTKRVLMVANRIEGKKGIAQVAKAARELSLSLALVGNVSDRNYLHEVAQAAGNLEFFENVSDEQLRDIYYGSAVHVCNSIDNFESGTLPILEAMICGTPVLTRRVGHVPDIDNEENLKVLTGDPDDVEGIKKALSEMLSDTKALEKQRSSAWNTAKNFNFERRAYLYQQLYRRVLNEAQPVSIIMPVCDRPEVMRRAMNAVAEQNYPNIELIVVDDLDVTQFKGGLISPNQKIVQDFAQTVSFPVRFIESGNYAYGLARARNLGIIEATGDILVFCDERMVMEPNAVSVFVDNLVPNVWLYGDKQTTKKDWVENFSCVYRRDIIKVGMFNERINQYGGMSQYMRSIIKQNGITTQYVAEAKAAPGAKSSNKNRKRQEIIAMKNLLWKLHL